MADLGVVVVSHNDAHWLERCLSSVFAHAGGVSIEVVVVESGCTDGTRELVESSLPDVRVLTHPNRGFAYANNRGLEALDARYLLLLNPDTEVIEGTFARLVEMLDARPWIGVAGVRQLKPDGRPCRSIHRFPSISRALGEALAVEHWPVHPAWAGERVLDPDAQLRTGECDWPTGSFLLARREALLGAGLLDERFFLFCEEPDFCLRVKRGGWQVWHLPQMAIVHHAGKHANRPRMEAQEAYARRQYAEKHFGPLYRRLYLAALGARYLMRAVGPDGDGVGRGGASGTARREGARRALLTLAGQTAPPFGPPPANAIPTSAFRRTR